MIRSAVQSDQPAVVALDAACFPKDAWSATSWADEFARADRQILIAETPPGEQVVPTAAPAGPRSLQGYVVLLVPPADAPVDLLRIAVDPAYRRTGLGHQLLTTALRNHPTRTILLEVAAGNEAATGLYAQHGFVEISRRRGYYTGGEDAVVMQRVGETR